MAMEFQPNFAGKAAKDNGLLKQTACLCFYMAEET